MNRIARACLLVALALGMGLPAEAVSTTRTRPHRLHATAAPAASGTLMGRPRYDRAERALILPYTGDQPAYVRGILRMPPRVFFDFDADAPGVGRVDATVNDHPTWLGWAISPHGPKGFKTRVTLIFRRPTAVTVTVDQRRHALVLLPALEVLTRPTPHPTPPPASVRPSLPPTIVPVPEASMAMPELSGTLHPSAPPMVHTAMGEPTPIPLPTPTPTPGPMLAAIATPTPAPTPSPAAPAEKPAGLDVSLATELPWLTYDEAFPDANAVHADLPSALAAHVGIAGFAPGWRGQVDAQVLGLGYADLNGQHARREWDLAAGLLRGAQWGGIGVSGGLGYMARYQASQGGLATAFGSPAWRLAHGPQLLAGLRLPVIDASGWDVHVTGGLTPALFSAMPAGSAALPWIWGTQVEVGLTAPVGPLFLGVGYRRAGYNGAGYSELTQGPYVSLGGPLNRF